MIVFAVLGALAGVFEVWLMTRAVGKRFHPASALLRLFVVGSVLYMAARSGHLLPGAVGWATAFAVSVAVAARLSRFGKE